MPVGLFTAVPLRTQNTKLGIGQLLAVSAKLALPTTGRPPATPICGSPTVVGQPTPTELISASNVMNTPIETSKPPFCAITATVPSLTAVTTPSAETVAIVGSLVR